MEGAWGNEGGPGSRSHLAMGNSSLSGPWEQEPIFVLLSIGCLFWKGFAIRCGLNSLSRELTNDHQCSLKLLHMVCTYVIKTAKWKWLSSEG